MPAPVIFCVPAPLRKNSNFHYTPISNHGLRVCILLVLSDIYQLGPPTFHKRKFKDQYWKFSILATRQHFPKNLSLPHNIIGLSLLWTIIWGNCVILVSCNQPLHCSCAVLCIKRVYIWKKCIFVFLCGMLIE